MGAAGLNLLLPTNVADSAVRLLCKYVLRDHGGEEKADFLISQFQPAFLNATAGVRAKLTLWEKIRLGIKTTGVVLKLAYAFVWQALARPVYTQRSDARACAYALTAL